MMTKKDFIAIARAVTIIHESDGRYDLARALSRIFEESNPNFDRGRFMAARGLSDDEIAARLVGNK